MSQKRLNHLLFTLILISVAPLASSQVEEQPPPPEPWLKVLHLKNRPAEEVTMLLAPLYQGSEVRFQADGNRMVVHAAMSDLVKIEEAVQALDVPPQQVEVRIRQVSGQALPSEEGDDKVALYSTTPAHSETATLLLQEGKPGLLRMMESRPQWNVAEIFQLAGGLASLYRDEEIRHLVGLSVKALLSGSKDQVRLEISPYFIQENTAQSHLSTVVWLPMNRWVPLAGGESRQVFSQSTLSGRQIYATAPSPREVAKIWAYATLLPSRSSHFSDQNPLPNNQRFGQKVRIEQKF